MRTNIMFSTKREGGQPWCQAIRPRRPRPGTPDDYSEIREIAAAVAQGALCARSRRDWDETRTAGPAGRATLPGRSWAALGISLPEEYGGSGAPLARCPRRPGGARQGVPPGGVPGLRGEHRSGEGRQPDRDRRPEGSGTCPPSSAATSTMAVAISEPDAGSAATDMITRAKHSRRQLDPERVEAVDLQRRRGRPLPCLHATE